MGYRPALRLHGKSIQARSRFPDPSSRVLAVSIGDTCSSPLRDLGLSLDFAKVEAGAVAPLADALVGALVSGLVESLPQCLD